HTMRLPKLEYLATTTLGQSYAAQSNDELAVQALKEAIDQLESMRNEVAGRETERQLFFENKLASYHSLVDLFVKQGRPFDALLYAERAKGRVLLDVVRSGKSDLAKSLTANEKEQLHRLNRRISEVNDSIGKQPAETASLKSLYEQLDAARLDYRSFEDSLY